MLSAKSSLTSILIAILATTIPLAGADSFQGEYSYLYRSDKEKAPFSSKNTSQYFNAVIYMDPVVYSDAPYTLAYFTSPQSNVSIDYFRYKTDDMSGIEAVANDIVLTGNYFDSSSRSSLSIGIGATDGELNGRVTGDLDGDTLTAGIAHYIKPFTQVAYKFTRSDSDTSFTSPLSANRSTRITYHELTLSHLQKLGAGKSLFMEAGLFKQKTNNSDTNQFAASLSYYLDKQLGMTLAVGTRSSDDPEDEMDTLGLALNYTYSTAVDFLLAVSNSYAKNNGSPDRTSIGAQIYIRH